MHRQLEERLATLKGEYEKGQTRIRQLEVELTSLRETMLRISGAILVLQELLSSSSSVTPVEQPSESSSETAQVQAQREVATSQAPSSDGQP